MRLLVLGGTGKTGASLVVTMSRDDTARAMLDRAGRSEQARQIVRLRGAGA